MALDKRTRVTRAVYQEETGETKTNAREGIINRALTKMEPRETCSQFYKISENMRKF